LFDGKGQKAAGHTLMRKSLSLLS